MADRNEAAKQFGTLLAGLLGRAGLSQNAFAERVGRASSYITYCVSGEKAPTEQDLEVWATVFGLSGAGKTEFFKLGTRAKAYMNVAAIPYLRLIERELVGLSESYAELQKAHLAQEEEQRLRAAQEGRASSEKRGTRPPKR